MNIKTKISGFEFCGFARAALAAIFAIAICLAFATATDAAPASITISAPVSSVTVNPGQTASYTVKIVRNGYLDKVSLSATGAPAGTTVTFSPNLTTTSSSTMTVTTPTSIVAGVYQIKINALETATGSAAAPIDVSLKVNPPPIVTLSATPRSQSIIAGNSAVYEIAFNRNGFTGPITLAVDDLPVGAIPSFSYTADKATLTITTSLNVGATQRFPMITGTAPGASVTPFMLTFRTNAGLIWTSSFNFGFTTWPSDVTRDVFGNVFVISSVAPAPSNDLHDFFVCKITKFLSNGTLVWTRTLDDLDQNEFDVPLSIVTDSNGNIYVAGITTGRIDPSVFTFWPEIVRENWWLAKFDRSGIRQWTKQDPVNKSSDDVVVILDGAQNPVLHAKSYDTLQKVSFDSDGRTLMNATYSLDHWIADVHAKNSAVYVAGAKFTEGDNPATISKLNGNGSLLWTRDLTVNGYDSRCPMVVSDNSGNVFAACNSSNRQTGEFRWLVRLDGNTGNVIWERRIPSSSGFSDGNFLRIQTDGDLLIGNNNAAGSRIEKYRAVDGERHWYRDLQNVYLYAGHNPPWDNSIFLTGRDSRQGTPAGIISGALFKYRLPDPALLPSGLVINPPSVLPGAQITMWGNNLSNVEEVLVGTTSVKFTIVSATEIRFDLPNLPPGQYEISARRSAEYVPASSLLTVF